MTKTKLNVKMALLVLGALVFNGCAPKTVYISKGCQVPEPTDRAPATSCSSLYPDDDDKFGDCLSEKIVLLKSDLEKWKIAFRGCK